MAAERLDEALAARIAELEAEGRSKGDETIVTAVLPPAGELGPRVRIAGYAEEEPRAMMQVHVKQNASGEFGTNLLGNYACPDINEPTGSSRSSVFCNEEFDAELDKALRLSGDERDALLRELVEFVHDEYLIVPVALLAKGYLVADGLDFTFGVDHRVHGDDHDLDHR